MITSVVRYCVLSISAPALSQTRADACCMARYLARTVYFGVACVSFQISCCYCTTDPELVTDRISWKQHVDVSYMPV